MIVRRYLSDDDELTQHLTRQLNTPLDWPKEAGLNTEHVAKIAAAAACDVAFNEAANGHLVDLFAALPLPGTSEGCEFWAALRRAAGDAALSIDPANAGGPFFDYLVKGNEGGIASRRTSETAEDRERFLQAWRDALGECAGVCRCAPALMSAADVNSHGPRCPTSWCCGSGSPTTRPRLGAGRRSPLVPAGRNQAAAKGVFGGAPSRHSTRPAAPSRRLHSHRVPHLPGGVSPFSDHAERMCRSVQ